MKETFGQKLARLRKEKRLTQEEIASRIYISPQAVSKWENDISSPDISALPQLADILGVSIDELLDHDSNSNNKEEEEKDNFEQVLEQKLEEKFGDNDEDDEDDDKKPSLLYVILTSSLFGLALVGYILMGVFWTDKGMGWSMGWVLLLVPIVISSIPNAIRKRSFCHFIYPVLVVIVYITLGFLGDYLGFEGWGVYWFLFITIPAYYMIFGPIDDYIKKNRK